LCGAKSPRDRALQLFASLGVWDTQLRNGCADYLCLADRVVEIVADRSLQTKVTEAQWAALPQLQRTAPQETTNRA